MEEINTYITDHYRDWLDHSEYHCSLAGMNGEAIDVLNEVLLSLLKKDESKLLKLLHAKSGKYTELDYFVLRMIKLNVYSLTSPYRSKYKAIPAADVDFSRLRIIDVNEDPKDKAAEILLKTQKVREIYDGLSLSPKAKKIFEHKFFHDLPFSKWKGKETLEELYRTYNSIIRMIQKKLRGESLF